VSEFKRPRTRRKQKKQEDRAVAGKPRDAAVIFQDGGWLPSWNGFDQTGNSAIRSADLQNPTLEINMM